MLRMFALADSFAVIMRNRAANLMHKIRGGDIGPVIATNFGVVVEYTHSFHEHWMHVSLIFFKVILTLFLSALLPTLVDD